MPKNGHGTSTEPNEWALDGLWRRYDQFDLIDAETLRRDLPSSIHIKSNTDWDGDPSLNTFEANHRATIAELVADLSRTDFIRLWYVAWLLALSGHHQAPQGPLFDYLRGLEAGGG